MNLSVADVDIHPLGIMNVRTKLQKVVELFQSGSKWTDSLGDPNSDEMISVGNRHVTEDQSCRFLSVFYSSEVSAAVDAG